MVWLLCPGQGLTASDCKFYLAAINLSVARGVGLLLALGASVERGLMVIACLHRRDKIKSF